MNSHPATLLAHGFTRHPTNERMYHRAETTTTRRLLASINPERPRFLTLWTPGYQLRADLPHWTAGKFHIDEEVTPDALQQILRRLGVTTTQTT